MDASRKVTLFVVIALVCVSAQVLSDAAKIEPEIADALEACSSLEQFTKWISELSGETEAVIRGRPNLILTRYALAEGALTAQQYLREQFHAMGLEVDTYEGRPWLDGNVIARLPGIARPEEVVIVCAHYDSTSEAPNSRAPGADDNASGTAGVLTAASILRNFRFERSVEFCLFTAEEFGLLGSTAYAEECLATGKNVVNVINMDMIIHPTNDAQPLLPLDVDIITDGASQKLATWLRASIEGYAGLKAEITVNPAAGSDHVPFWDIGSYAVAVAENTPDEIWSGATTVYHTTNDVITQQYADLPFGLSVARGVAAAAMTLAEWEPSSALPFGATTSVELDGVAHFDAGNHRAFISAAEGQSPDGAAAECQAENLLLQGTAGAWAGGVPHEAVSHSTSFETFVPRSTTLPKGQEVVMELTIRGSGDFAIDRKAVDVFACCRVEVWARSIESFALFDGTVSLSSAGTEISGDFSSDAFAPFSTTIRKGETLSGWSAVIPFNGRIGQPITLCARLSQTAYAGRGGVAECTWTEPLRLTVASTHPNATLETAGFANEPQVSLISTGGTNLTLTWQPFSQGVYIVEQSDDLISWTPIGTTPLTTWETEDWGSHLGFFRIRSE